MPVIDVLSFNIGADNDIKYGSEKITQLHLTKFIEFYKITNQELINYLIFFIDSFDNLNNYNETYTHSDIISYHLTSNELYSVTIKINDKIRYLTSYDPEIVETFIINKKNAINQYIVNSNIDVICLQNYDDPYIMNDFGDYKQINWATSIANYTIITNGMLSNCILYKSKTSLNINMECTDSYLTEYGLIGNFNIWSDKTPDIKTNIKIISGIWSMYSLQDVSLQDVSLQNISLQNNKCWQLNQMHSDLSLTNYMFVGSTDLTFATNDFTNHKIQNANLKSNITIKPTIDKKINKYYPHSNNDSYVIYADHIYTNQVDLIEYDLTFNISSNNLINTYRPSGYLSDHFGLYFSLYIS